MQPFFEFSFSFAAADPLEFSMFPREKSESEALSNWLLPNALTAKKENVRE